MKRAVLTLVIILCSILRVNGQEEAKVWYDAKIKLLDGRELVGKANYNIRYRMIQVEINGKVETFQEDRVERMHLTQGEYIHDFRLVAILNDANTIELLLAELIYQSYEHHSFFKKYTASREDKVYTYFYSPTTNSVVPIQTTTPNKPDLDDDSFTSGRKKFLAYSRRESKNLMVNYDGNSKPLTRKNFYKAYSDKAKQLKKFQKDNALGFNKDEDIIRMMSYYDEISN